MEIICLEGERGFGMGLCTVYFLYEQFLEGKKIIGNLRLDGEYKVFDREAFLKEMEGNR